MPHRCAEYLGLLYQTAQHIAVVEHSSISQVPWTIKHGRNRLVQSLFTTIKFFFLNFDWCITLAEILISFSASIEICIIVLCFCVYKYAFEMFRLDDILHLLHVSLKMYCLRWLPINSIKGLFRTWWPHLYTDRDNCGRLVAVRLIHIRQSGDTQGNRNNSHCRFRRHAKADSTVRTMCHEHVMNSSCQPSSSKMKRITAALKTTCTGLFLTEV